MTALIPMAMYGLEVPSGDVAIPARPDIPSAFRITMAAIDPSAPIPEGDAAPRATLKVIRQPLNLDDYSEDDDEDDEDDESVDFADMEKILAAEDSDDDEDMEDDDDEEEVNGGPSDPAKSKSARKAEAKAAIMKMILADEEENGAQTNGKSAKGKGKMAALNVDFDDDDSEEDSEDGDVEEFVICTLDPLKNYQQALDITIGEDERVYFKVSGTHSIFLTGNYVEPLHNHGHDDEDSEDDSEGDYDLEPDSDELDDEEIDELDGLDDPRIMEIMEEDDEAPELIKSTKKDKKEKKAEKVEKKGNKRAADDSIDESLEDMITKESAAAPATNGTTNGEAATNGEPKLSKKQLKKLKKNDGAAAAAPTAAATDAAGSAKSDKKVSFAKDLEQGPTPTKATAAAADKPAANGTAGSLGVKKVQGVTLDDKKLGTGPAAKSGDRVGLRYIGKLAKDGKVFDSNKKGKPFSFKLGAGEVIKGWDVGIVGMSVGGERRVTIPAAMGYGSKGAPPAIPANASLIFDVKMLEIGKGGK